jgi:hypothetical protein
VWELALNKEGVVYAKEQTHKIDMMLKEYIFRLELFQESD